MYQLKLEGVDLKKHKFKCFISNRKTVTVNYCDYVKNWWFVNKDDFTMGHGPQIVIARINPSKQAEYLLNNGVEYNKSSFHVEKVNYQGSSLYKTVTKTKNIRTFFDKVCQIFGIERKTKEISILVREKHTIRKNISGDSN